MESNAGIRDAVDGDRDAITSSNGRCRGGGFLIGRHFIAVGGEDRTAEDDAVESVVFLQIRMSGIVVQGEFVDGPIGKPQQRRDFCARYGAGIVD